jgi:hypothetical protein
VIIIRAAIRRLFYYNKNIQMAINVNTVYKTVLLILNKEQRGYITPDEFNRLGTQVQLEIFETYFEDLNQQLRVPQTSDEYANRVENIEEKIDIFKKFSACTGAIPIILPADVHRLGMLAYREKEIQVVDRKDHLLINKSPLTTPTNNNPVYILEGTGAPSAAPSQAYVYPTSIAGTDVTAYYVRAPTNPRWGYSIGGLGQYLYDNVLFNATVGALVVANNALTDSIITNTSDGFPADAVYSGTAFNTAAITTSNPSGWNAELTVEVSGGIVVNVDIVNAGSGFIVGDTITISNNAAPNGIGGSTPVVITLTEADLYSGSTLGSINFELHPSEQVNLILNILMYTGVIIRDPQIVQNAAQMVQQDEVNAKS